MGISMAPYSLFVIIQFREIHVNLIFRITMGRIRHDLKLEIVRMHRSGTSVAGIRGRLISMGHIKYSSQTEY